MERDLEENIQSGLRNFFIYIFFFVNRFVLKTWINRRGFYFVGILNGVGDMFLLGCPQVLFLLNVGSRNISEPNKSLIQKGESSYR